jgi:hypothetical protein
LGSDSGSGRSDHEWLKILPCGNSRGLAEGRETMLGWPNAWPRPLPADCRPTGIDTGQTNVAEPNLRVLARPEQDPRTLHWRRGRQWHHRRQAQRRRASGNRIKSPPTSAPTFDAVVRFHDARPRPTGGLYRRLWRGAFAHVCHASHLRRLHASRSRSGPQRAASHASGNWSPTQMARVLEGICGLPDQRRRQDIATRFRDFIALRPCCGAFPPPGVVYRKAALGTLRSSANA